MKNIKIVENIQSLFAKRIYGPRFSYLKFVGRLEQFNIQNVEKREKQVKFDIPFIELYMAIVS